MNFLNHKVFLGIVSLISVVALTLSIALNPSPSNELFFRVTDDVVEYRLGDSEWKPLIETHALLPIDASNGLVDIDVNDEGELVATYEDGTTAVIGSIPLEAATGIKNISLTVDGELLVTLTDNTSFNLGSVLGRDGVDGKTPSIRIQDGFIQWQYVGEDTWTNLIALTDLEGATGSNGLDGQDGSNGKNPLFRVADGFVQWQYDGDTTWTNLLLLADLEGVDGQDGTNGVDGQDGTNGREVEFQTNNTHVQWRFVGDTSWTNLLPLADLEGADGQDGANGVDGQDGANGLDGDDGREVEFQTSDTHIQWRFVNDNTWTDLVAIDDLKGTNGIDGNNGNDGTNGMSTYELYKNYYPGYTDNELTWLNEFILGELAITITFQYESNGDNVIEIVQTFKGVSSDDILTELTLVDDNDLVPPYFLETGLYQLTVNSPISELQFYSASEYDLTTVTIGDEHRVMIKASSENEHFGFEMHAPTSLETREVYFALAITNAYELQAVALNLDEDFVLLENVSLPDAFDLDTEFANIDADLKALMEEIAIAYGLNLEDDDADNLTFERLNFIPIGKFDMAILGDVPFIGNLFGNQKTISNLEIITKNGDTAPGFFAIISGPNVIENLELKNLYIEQKFSDVYAGGLVGYSVGNIATFNNITMSGNIDASSGLGAGSLVGIGEGFGNISNELNINNVNSTVHILSDRYAGGIVGFAVGDYSVKILNTTYAGSITSSGSNLRDVGGLVGGVQSSQLSISDSSFTGQLESQNGSGVNSSLGGLVGLVEDSLLNISASTVSGTIKGIQNIGGLVGLIKDSDGATIETSTNNATLTGSESIGGLIGNVNASELTVMTSENKGSLETTNSGPQTQFGGIIGFIQINSDVTLDTVKNSGNISNSAGNDLPSVVGGLIGESKSSVVALIDTRVAGSISGDGEIGGVIGKNDSSTITSTGENLSTIEITGNSSVGKVVGQGTAPSFNVFDSIAAIRISFLDAPNSGAFTAIITNLNYDSIILTSDITLSGVTTIFNSKIIALNDKTISNGTIKITSGDFTFDNGTIDVQANPLSETINGNNVEVGMIYQVNSGTLTIQDVDFNFSLTNGMGLVVFNGTLILEDSTLTGAGIGLFINELADYDSIKDNTFNIDGDAIVIKETPQTITREEIDLLLTSNTFGPNVTNKVTVNGVVYNQTLAEASISSVLAGTALDETIYSNANMTGVTSDNFAIFNDFIFNANDNSYDTIEKIQTLVNTLNRLNAGEATLNDLNYFNNLGLIQPNEDHLTAFNLAMAIETNYLNLAALKSVMVLGDVDVPSTFTATLGSVMGNSIPVTWTQATDNLTPQADLKYTVYAKTVGVADLLIGEYMNVTTTTVSGLALSTTYTLIIIVEDLNGNETMIETAAFTTANALLFAGGNGTQQSPYQISNWYQLSNIKFFTDAHYILMNDLDNTTEGYVELAAETSNNNKGWSPIINQANSAVVFSGVLDGSNFTIQNLTFNNPTGFNIGLFSKIQGTLTEVAIIKDLNLSFEIINVNNNDVRFIGGLAGDIAATKLENLNINGSIVGSGGKQEIGLVAGQFRPLPGVAGVPERRNTVKNLRVQGTITTNATRVGGIAGNLYGSDLNGVLSDVTIISSHTNFLDIFLGGIAGRIDTLNAENIISIYDITYVNGKRRIGGLAGELASSNTSKSSITNFYTVGRLNNGTTSISTATLINGFIGEGSNKSDFTYSNGYQLIKSNTIQTLNPTTDFNAGTDSAWVFTSGYYPSLVWQNGPADWNDESKISTYVDLPNQS